MTAYGHNNDDGLAPACSAAWGRAARPPSAPPRQIRTRRRGPTYSDLHAQVERVRITAQPLGLEEMSKLWATFQTQYRISAAYQVSVVLIESTRPARTPLPALGRGSQDDEGVATQPDLTTPFPTLLSAETPDPQFGALLGETVTLRGLNLAGTSPAVRLTHQALDLERTVTAFGTHTDEEMTFRRPNSGELPRRILDGRGLGRAPRRDLPPDDQPAGIHARAAVTNFPSSARDGQGWR